MRSFFARLDEKHKLLGNFEKILKFFDENSLEKLNFLFFIFFRKIVNKNRALGNNTIFLQQFFRFREGGIFPPFPLATPLINSASHVLSIVFLYICSVFLHISTVFQM